MRINFGPGAFEGHFVRIKNRDSGHYMYLPDAQYPNPTWDPALWGGSYNLGEAAMVQKCGPHTIGDPCEQFSRSVAGTIFRAFPQRRQGQFVFFSVAAAGFLQFDGLHESGTRVWVRAGQNHMVKTVWSMSRSGSLRAPFGPGKNQAYIYESFFDEALGVEPRVFGWAL